MFCTLTTAFILLTHLAFLTSGYNNTATTDSSVYTEDKEQSCEDEDYFCPSAGMHRCCKHTDINCCYEFKVCCPEGQKCVNETTCEQNCGPLSQPEDYYCNAIGMDRCCTINDTNCCYDEKICCRAGLECVNTQCIKSCVEPEDYYCYADGMHRCCTANDTNCCYDEKFCCPADVKCINGKCPEPCAQPDDYYCDEDGMHRCCTANDTNCCYDSKICCPAGLKCVNDTCQQDICGPSSQPEDYFCAATDMNRCCTVNDKNCCYESKFCCPLGLNCVNGTTCSSSSQQYKSINSLICTVTFLAVVYYIIPK